MCEVCHDVLVRWRASLGCLEGPVEEKPPEAEAMDYRDRLMMVLVPIHRSALDVLLN